MDSQITTEVIVKSGIILGIIFGIPFTPVICLLRKMFIVPFKHQRILKKAINDGHVVKAKLIKSKDDIDERGLRDSSRQIGIYQYEYNNKIYKTKQGSVFELPDEITLYFERNPRHAVVERELGIYESPMLRCYIVSALIMGIFVSAFLKYVGVKYGL